MIMPNCHVKNAIATAIAAAALAIGAHISGLSAELSRGFAQLDSHAKMHVIAEQYCTSFEDTGQKVDAYAFADSRTSIPDISIKNVPTAHDDLYTALLCSSSCFAFENSHHQGCVCAKWDRK